MSRILWHGRYRKYFLASLIALLAFTAGIVVANVVPVGLVQSIAGNRILIPKPELTIVSSTWSINASTSTVTDVDLLVTTNSPVWQLKLFKIYVEVSCLDAANNSFICSTGQASIVLPTHGIGLRPVRILLDRPVTPETTEIEDLSFIVTDLAKIPPQPPTIFGGADPAVITIQQGSTMNVQFMVVGAFGVPSGTQAAVDAFVPQGVSIDFPNGNSCALIIVVKSMPPSCMIMATMTADSSAMVGTTDIQVTVNGNTPTRSFFDVFFIWFEVQPQVP